MSDDDDLIGGLVGEALFGRLRHTSRAQRWARLFFGLLGTGLGMAGAVYIASNGVATTNVPLRATMVALFVFLACFSLFNVALARSWRWPGFGLLCCLVLLFVTRIAFGR